MMTKKFEVSGFLNLGTRELSLETAQLKVKVAYSGELRDDPVSGRPMISATCMRGELTLTKVPDLS